MLDIQSLERRWLRYKIKAYLPYVAVLSVSAAGFIIYASLFPAQDSKIAIEPSAITPSHQSPRQNSSPPAHEIILEPSMDFIQTIDPKPVLSPVAAVTTPNTTPKPTLSHPPATVQTPLPKETVFQPPVIPKEPLSNKVSSLEKKGPTPIVKRDEAPLNINELQARFQVNSNPNLGVFIARYHYDHGNYPEAYNYALKTNAINNKMEESWIIFAKSLLKMGKTDQARKTLQLYISQSNSENAKSLLDSLDKDIKK